MAHNEYAFEEIPNVVTQPSPAVATEPDSSSGPASNTGSNGNGSALRYRGRVDRVEPSVAAGWAFVEGAEESPAELEFVQDGVVLGTVTASDYRKDLEGAGLRGGRCAFTFRAPSGVTLDSGKLDVRFKESGISLPRTKKTSLSDDPAARHVAELDDTLGELRDSIAGRLQRIERGLTQISRELLYHREDREQIRADMESLRGSLEQLEGYLTVGFITAVREIVREEVSRNREEPGRATNSDRWTRGVLALATIALFANIVGMGFIFFYQ